MYQSCNGISFYPKFETVELKSVVIKDSKGENKHIDPCTFKLSKFRKDKRYEYPVELSFKRKLPERPVEISVKSDLS